LAGDGLQLPGCPGASRASPYPPRLSTLLFTFATSSRYLAPQTSPLPRTTSRLCLPALSIFPSHPPPMGICVSALRFAGSSHRTAVRVVRLSNFLRSLSLRALAHYQVCEPSDRVSRPLKMVWGFRVQWKCLSGACRCCDVRPVHPLSHPRPLFRPASASSLPFTPWWPRTHIKHCGFLPFAPPASPRPTIYVVGASIRVSGVSLLGCPEPLHCVASFPC